METKDERIKIPTKDWSRVFKEEMKERTKLRNETKGKYNKGVKFFSKYYDQKKKK